MPSTIGEAWIAIKPDTSNFENLLSSGVGSSVKKIAGSLALFAIPAYAVKSAADFDQSLQSIAARADLTRGQVAKIGDAFLGTSGQVTFSANAIAAAYAPVAGQLGMVEHGALNAHDALLFMRDAMDLAEASGQPLSDTTAALAKVMQAYGLSVAQASDASDILWTASSALGIPLADIADTVDKLHAKLGPLTPDLADVSTLLLDVSSHGLTGSRALLLVSTGMNTLLGGSKATSAEIAALNLHLFDANGHFVGMQGVLEQLTPKLSKMTEAQRLFAEKALFGSGASKALDATLLAGLPGWSSAALAADKTGSAHKAAGVATDTFQGKMKILEAQVTDTATKLGTDLLPYVEDFVGFVSKNLGTIEKFGAAILGLYAVRKGESLIEGLVKDGQRLLGLAGKISGLGGGAAAAASVQRVYVVNMAPGGGGIAPPGSAAAGGAVPTISNQLLVGAPLASQASNSWDVWSHVITLWQGVNTQIAKDAVTIAMHVRNTAQGANMSDQEMQALESAIESGAVGTPAQISNFLKSWKGITGAQETLNGIVGKTAPQIGGGFVTLENQLAGMTGDFSSANLYTNALSDYITKYGPLTQFRIDAFYQDAGNIHLNAFDIALSLSSMVLNLASAPQSAAEIASALAGLHKSIPKSIHLPAGGLGSVRATAGGGFFDRPTNLLVGEAGPEVVLNQHQFQAMMGGSTKGTGGVTQHNYFYGVGKETVELVDQRIQRNNRSLQLAMRRR